MDEASKVKLIQRMQDGLDKALLNLHRPQDINVRHARLWCMVCQKDWPCKKYKEAHARLKRRESE
jgi:hypothetical protein